MPVVNLKEAFKRGKRFTGSYRLSPKEVGLPADLGELREPVEVYLEIYKEDRGYRVFMSITGKVVLECSRCLTVFENDIGREHNFRIESYPTKDVMYLSPSDLEVSFYEDEENVDIAQLVREQIILSIPTKPLCDPECKGIHLEEAHADNPFAVLKRFLP
ncbi:YceD family protein [Thermocrinis minervae]|uniref:23S rRNA accumulation protein YceD n=1 Tax=Thermocrinis minervae TaxID=381751 RepID=A0A1M6QJ91_9AQUI|nr:YceD family protein [Thermocrinis minervae]SHK20235.1 uncharacterized protein SAMN05444391_0258 [Thermocrinis minervae]